jgi:phage-related protein
MSIGKDIVKGIWNGINSMVSWIGDKISGFASSVLDGFKLALEIASPSKAFARASKWIPAGIVQGIESEADTVYSAIDTLAADMTDAFGSNTLSLQKGSLALASSGMQTGTTNIYNTQNFMQTLNSPKSLDLRTTYRQTKSLLASANKK